MIFKFVYFLLALDVNWIAGPAISKYYNIISLGSWLAGWPGAQLTKDLAPELSLGYLGEFRKTKYEAMYSLCLQESGIDIMSRMDQSIFRRAQSGTLRINYQSGID